MPLQPQPVLKYLCSYSPNSGDASKLKLQALKLAQKAFSKDTLNSF